MSRAAAITKPERSRSFPLAISAPDAEQWIMRCLHFFAATAALMPFTGHADMCGIPFTKAAHLYEPKQDAIIAWNGKEELLYLQTTLAASQDTKVLEMMPLPNRPTVEACDPGIFKRCAFLLPQGLADTSDGGSADGADPFGGGTPAGEVVERKLIGSHDLRIVQLHDAKEFAAWVAKEFSAEGSGLTVPEPLLNAVGDYAKDGYKWYLFDVVDLKKEATKKTPLRIRFATDTLYYPMRNTKVQKGQTTVSLSILTNVLFNKEDCIGIPRESIEVPAKPVDIPAVKLSWIDPPIYELLGQPAQAKLRSWKISGAIDSFEKDLLVRNPAPAKADAAAGE